MTPNQIFHKMYDNDAFSIWLGIECVEMKTGFCQLQMTLRDEMLNGFGIAHGGITYALADSALAFAANSHGKLAVSIETSISHIKSCQSGDVLTATTKQISIGRTLGRYQVSIQNQNNIEVALFYGTVFRKDTEWK